MIRNLKKKNNPELESITAELTIVPQGQMVKPRTFIVNISKDPIQKLIKNEVENLILNNSSLRKIVRG